MTPGNIFGRGVRGFHRPTVATRSSGWSWRNRNSLCPDVISQSTSKRLITVSASCRTRGELQHTAGGSACGLAVVQERKSGLPLKRTPSVPRRRTQENLRRASERLRSSSGRCRRGSEPRRARRRARLSPPPSAGLRPTPAGIVYDRQMVYRWERAGFTVSAWLNHYY